jgi:hypothetical protein
MSTSVWVFWLPHVGELNQVIVEFVHSSGMELTRTENILMVRCCVDDPPKELLLDASLYTR